MSYSFPSCRATCHIKRNLRRVEVQPEDFKILDVNSLILLLYLDISLHEFSDRNHDTNGPYAHTNQKDYSVKKFPKKPNFLFKQTLIHLYREDEGNCSA